MLFILLLTIGILLVIALNWRKRERQHQEMMAVPSYRRTILRQQKIKTEKSRSNSPLKNIATDLNMGTNVRFLPILGLLIGIGFGTAAFHSAILGAVAGFFAPYIIVRIISVQLEKEYYRNVEDTLRLMAGIFAAGGQVEDWITQMRSRVSGQMRKEADMAYALMRNGASARDILIRWRDITNEEHFSYTLGSIADVLHDSADLVAIIDESINRLLRDEQFNQEIKVMSKSSNRMIFVIAGFPVFTFLIMHHMLLTILSEVPWLWGVVIVSIATIVAVLIWYRKITTSAIGM